jgi:hypothetical protein
MSPSDLIFGFYKLKLDPDGLQVWVATSANYTIAKAQGRVDEDEDYDPEEGDVLVGGVDLYDLCFAHNILLEEADSGSDGMSTVYTINTPGSGIIPDKMPRTPENIQFVAGVFQAIGLVHDLDYEDNWVNRDYTEAEKVAYGILD